MLCIDLVSEMWHDSVTPMPAEFLRKALLVAVATHTTVAARADDAAAPIDFNRDIRPILSENCYHCHGPDGEAREGNLRLDIEADAATALAPGDLPASEVWHRVSTADLDDLMPPPKSKRRLTAAQKDLLKRWIEEGAGYADHWAYVPPQRPVVPEPVNGGRIGNAIDQFVAERLKKEGLTASPGADRVTLIRRLSFDLTGLPPAPDEVASFVADKSPDAYEKVVDRLLASPRFGERWARPWLDLARYADSNGFQADQLRDSWAFRDWVIDALNDNMPFDQFSIEQLAGDLLPDATLDQKIATGFHRTVTCNVEAGVHPEANRTDQVVDRVNTTGTVWLGTTMECSQCHDHKYDPFSMRDYYGLFAYFNNTPLEVEGKGGVSFDFYGPKMDLPLPPAEASARAALVSEKVELSKALASARTTALANRDEMIAGLREQIDAAAKGQSGWTVAEVTAHEGTGGEAFNVIKDGSVLVMGEVPDKTTYSLKLKSPGGKVGAIRVEALTNNQLPGKGPGRGDPVRSNFILSEIRAVIGGEKVGFAAARADFSQVRWDVKNAIDGDSKTGWAIAPEFGKAHWASFVLARPVETDAGDEIDVELEQLFGGGRTIGCVRISVAGQDVETMEVPDAVQKLLMKEGKRTAKDDQTIDDYLAGLDPDVKRLSTGVAAIKTQLKELEPPSTLVMVEMEKPRETFILNRGNYLSPGDRVQPATPAVLHPIDPGLPKNRLGMARWLMSTDNPLVARVTVNRWWAEIFGRGIVATVEDFGTQSEPPTHPEVLDWLAMEFMESGWDMKHVLRLIVTSATYRQESHMTPELLEKDPANHWLARAPRYRYDAETIRDNALAVSGMLSTKMGGEPVMPHQPTGIWRQIGRNEPKWTDATNEDRYRRGVYVVWRRAAPYPSFVNFDGGDRSACVVGRPRTNTPLQALTLLNDPVYVELALALASRVLEERPDADDEQRIEHAFKLVLSRAPNAAEVATLQTLLNAKQEKFLADPGAAKIVVAGENIVFKAPKSVSEEDLAAWFFVTNALLNLDETITRG